MGLQLSEAGLYRPPVFEGGNLTVIPQMIISLPVQTDARRFEGEGEPVKDMEDQVSASGL
jgi:hypothetical protein